MQEEGADTGPKGKTDNSIPAQSGTKIPESNRIECHQTKSLPIENNSVKDLIDNIKQNAPTKLSDDEVKSVTDWAKKNSSNVEYELSQKGIDFIKESEGGFKDKVYDANSGKNATFDKEGKIIGKGDWTIGYGHKLTASEISNKTYNSNGITEKAAEKLLLGNAKSSIDRINKLVTSPISQNQFDALVSFAFQQGNYNKSLTNIIGLVNSSKFAEAAEMIKNTGNKKSRRESESEMFKNGTYLPPQYYQNPTYYKAIHPEMVLK